jgi:sirohydrochlorin cobaltochelatase
MSNANNVLINPSPQNQQVIVILAAHGAPATDYSAGRVGMLMAIEFAGGKAAQKGLLRLWKEKLENEIRNWPRTTANDPYKNAVDELSAALTASTGLEVIAAYNEFCSPTIKEAIDQAAEKGASHIVVIPTMLLRGNQHTEEEISEAVNEGRQHYPKVCIDYAWPFPESHLVDLFSSQINRFV